MAEPEKELALNQPSSTPEQRASGLFGLLQVAIGKAMQDMDCCLPARVVSFDRVTNRATVEPMYKITSTGNDTFQMGQIDSIPVLMLGGSGVFISADLKQGDLGWIIANDQDISLFLQDYEPSPGNTKRNHSFSDAYFIPDQMKEYYLSGQTGEMAIQTQAGTTYITIIEGKINIQTNAVFTIVEDVDLKGDPDITIPKGSIASAEGNKFKLLEDVTLDSSGSGKGNFKSVVIGDIDCGENKLKTIETKIAGWNEVNNENKGKPQGSDNGITVSNGQITVTSGAINISGSVNITGEVLITGGLKVDGDITASGTVQDKTPV